MWWRVCRFKQAMSEQKSHGVVMHGPKMKALKIDNQN